MPLSVTRRSALASLGMLLASPSLRGNEKGNGTDPLAPWRTNVKVRPVSTTTGRHTIHSYYLSNPESPDGKRVLYYASAAADGHTGYLCVQDRASGAETVVAKNITTEDAHRAACQQWVSGGKRIAYHDVRDGEWLVVAVDLPQSGPTVPVGQGSPIDPKLPTSADSPTKSGRDDRTTFQEKIVARNHQLSFGQPTANLLPLYGCHWNPGEHRNLELTNLETGETRTVVTAAEVEKSYHDWVAEEFAGKPISIFFPILSPDLRQVFFKIAAPGGGDFRSKQASHRQGIIAYDLEKSRFSFFRGKWGHPAWHPDSRHISEMGNLLFDTQDGSYAKIPNLPSLRGCHPSVSPDGKLLVQDGYLGELGDSPDQWGVVVGDIRGEQFQVLHKFDNSRGAKSWRKNHPHPIFSADGRRVYFNVNSGDWTQLMVAEVGGA